MKRTKLTGHVDKQHLGVCERDAIVLALHSAPSKIKIQCLSIGAQVLQYAKSFIAIAVEVS